MAEIIQFIPRKDLAAKHNLKEFIDMARDLLPTWREIADFDWHSARWVTSYKTIRFINYENRGLHPSSTPQAGQLMHPEFMEIAKAYLRYRHHVAPHRNIGREIVGLRILEHVLRLDMGVPDITKVGQRHYNDSVALINQYKGAPFIAIELLNILKKLADNAIVATNAYHWNHPYYGSNSYANTRGAFAPQEVKDEKLPDQDALLAIGDVFSRGYSQPLEDVDVLITSITALLLCAPMRINETLRFRVDCIGSDVDRNGKTQYFLRYWVPKTKEFARKPIPETMAETALEAVARLKKISEDGRRLARHMETDPQNFYRHTRCPNVGDDEILSPLQAMEALGITSRRSLADYLEKRTGSQKTTGYTLNSLWQIILRDHEETNPNFPYQEALIQNEVRPLKMSESLLCFHRYQFGTNFGTSPVLLAPFDRSYYARRLDAREMKNRKNSRPMCFYTRHGFEPKKLKSHAPRHLLNRLAQQSGLSVDVITAWSNRSSHHQTLTYLANDQGEAAVAASALMGIDSQQDHKDPVTGDEAAVYGQGPIHRSRYGLCRRSWRVGPCNKFADCLNCSELLMCKGDKFAAELIARERESIVLTYNAAQAAITQGEKSATRWLKVMEPQIKKLDSLLSVLNDPNIPDGSPIEITGTDFSHEQVLVEGKASEIGVRLVKREKLALDYGDDLLACLDELKGPGSV